MVYTYAGFTDYNLSEKEERPELRLYEGVDATLLTDNFPVLEIKAQDKRDLKDQLEGFAEIFKAAADYIVLD